MKFPSKQALLFLTPWLVAPLATTAVAEVPDIAIAQASEAGGTPLPRPTVGVASDGAPTLPFHVALTYRCPAGTERQQLFVSIADTARVEDATGKASPQVLRVDVPLKQLQWLMQPAQACANVGSQRSPDDRDDNGTRYFRLHAGTAGYASVTCAARDGQALGATSSAPLDVWLSCPADEPGEPAAR